MIQIRPYAEDDAAGVAVLVDQLGYEAMPWDVTRRVAGVTRINNDLAIDDSAR